MESLRKRFMQLVGNKTMLSNNESSNLGMEDRVQREDYQVLWESYKQKHFPSCGCGGKKQLNETMTFGTGEYVPEVDDVNYAEYYRAIGYEADRNPDMDLTDIKKLVARNLKNDPEYYIKDGQFQTEGVGYTQLKQDKATGAHASSGYGEALTPDTENRNWMLKEDLVADLAVTLIEDLGMDITKFPKDLQAEIIEESLQEARLVLA